MFSADILFFMCFLKPVNETLLHSFCIIKYWENFIMMMANNGLMGKKQDCINLPLAQLKRSRGTQCLIKWLSSAVNIKHNSNLTTYFNIL